MRVFSPSPFCMDVRQLGFAANTITIGLRIQASNVYVVARSLHARSLKLRRFYRVWKYLSRDILKYN